MLLGAHATRLIRGRSPCLRSLAVQKQRVALGRLPNAFGKPCAAYAVQASMSFPKSQHVRVTRSNDGAARANVSGIAPRRRATLFGLTLTIAEIISYRSIRGTTAAAFAQNACGMRTRRLAAHVDCHARCRGLISKRRTWRTRNKFVSAARPAAAINCASWRDVVRTQKLHPECIMAAISPAHQRLPFGSTFSDTKCQFFGICVPTFLKHVNQKWF